MNFFLKSQIPRLFKIILLKERVKHMKIHKIISIFVKFYPNFKGYIPFRVITKYWLYTHCCIIYT